jgi:hypothetical protein
LNELAQIRSEEVDKVVEALEDVKEQIKLTRPRVAVISKLTLFQKTKTFKKKILSILQQARAIRASFNTLRSRFEGCKLTLKTLPKYKALLGDDVDRMLADWIYSNCCPIPIDRLGNGYYQFGTKKIYAKITNGKLVIRVGGGYMGIDEFMYYYGA